MSATQVLRTGVGAALLVNAVPHGVAALRGAPFPTPFADPPGVGFSSPKENAVWSGVNLLAAGLLLLRGKAKSGDDKSADGDGSSHRSRTRAERIVGAASALGTAAGLTWYFGMYVPSVRDQ